jgi:hypothetical protein
MSGKIVGALISVALTAVSINHFRYEIGDAFWIDRRPIVAQIKLDNRCEFLDRVFVVRDLATGSYASFAGGRAKLRTRERNRVVVEFAPRFRDVTYYGQPIPVRKNMTMVAKCGTRRFGNVPWFG